MFWFLNVLHHKQQTVWNMPVPKRIPGGKKPGAAKRVFGRPIIVSKYQDTLRLAVDTQTRISASPIPSQGLGLPRVKWLQPGKEKEKKFFT
jgi:hypothetical protein